MEYKTNGKMKEKIKTKGKISQVIIYDEKERKREDTWYEDATWHEDEKVISRVRYNEDGTIEGTRQRG